VSRELQLHRSKYLQGNQISSFVCLCCVECPHRVTIFYYDEIGLIFDFDMGTIRSTITRCDILALLDSEQAMLTALKRENIMRNNRNIKTRNEIGLI
jgi:hypothetical protein